MPIECQFAGSDAVEFNGRRKSATGKLSLYHDTKAVRY